MEIYIYEIDFGNIFMDMDMEIFMDMNMDMNIMDLRMWK